MSKLREDLKAAATCGLPQALEVMGERWSFLILRAAFNGLVHFEEFSGQLGIARNILSNRLDTLVEAGIMERRCYDEARGRHDYVLTRKGAALWPVMMTLRQWGDEWMTEPGDEPVAIRHLTCGELTTGFLHCECCGEQLQLRDLRVEPGPGLRDPNLVPDGTAVAPPTASGEAKG